MTTPPFAVTPNPLPLRLLGLGLFSAAMLLSEIGLTRIFSVLYYPPFAFTVLSLAVLGMGLGAALATWQAQLRSPGYIPLYMTGAALSLLATLLVAFVLLAPLQGSIVLEILLFSTTLLIYLWGGIMLAALFSADAQRSPRLYFVDLVGAGLGALVAAVFFNTLGMVNGMISAASIFATAGILMGQDRRQSVALVALLLTAIALAANLAGRFPQPDMARLPVEKPIVERLANGGQIVATRWDAFARTDLVDPGNGSPYELYMDGAAGSIMPPALQDELLWQDIGLFPFATEQPQRVFIIGPGGGLDIWFGLQSGTDEMVAVEVNPASSELVREFAQYNGDLYANPEVRIISGEGRSELQRDGAAYDLIFLSQVVTLAAERTGYALVENSNYTIEAFTTYFDHLSPDGMIALKLYDEPTLTRALSTVLATLNQQGLADAEALRHVIVLLDANADPAIPLLMVRTTPFDRDDSLSIGAVARRVGFTPLYLPDVVAEAPLDAIQAGSMTFADVIRAAEIDLAPTNDDRPFFFQFERGMPQNLRTLLWSMITLMVVCALVLWFVQRGDQAPAQRTFSLYFAALGMGFMMVEIALIQQTRLFLGHPTYAIAVTLVTLLVGGGIGSGIAGRWVARMEHRGGDGARTARQLPFWAISVLLIWLLLWIVGWTRLNAHFFPLQRSWRTGVVALAMLPLALAMGMPFPLGLRIVNRLADPESSPEAAGNSSVGTGTKQVALAWAINGLMSVAGTVLAVVLAIPFGFRFVLWGAGIVYLVALLTCASWNARFKGF